MIEGALILILLSPLLRLINRPLSPNCGLKPWSTAELTDSSFTEASGTCKSCFIRILPSLLRTFAVPLPTAYIVDVPAAEVEAETD